MAANPFPHLHPVQVCFVVDDVAKAVDECVARFGWGPFYQFTAPVPEAQYRDWSGPKRTDVALGMAGPVQVELIHVHEGHDTVEVYQSRYGAGLQHLGIQCRDREEAIAALVAIGSTVDDQGEYPGIRFAFVDTPTGPGMFELLQPDGEVPVPGATTDSHRKSVDPPSPSVRLDRATIATNDLDAALDFYARAFRWEDPQIEARTLRFGTTESAIRRVRTQAGKLLLELVEPPPAGDDPYARHLARGDHGLVHAGGVTQSCILPEGASLECEWLEEGEAFALYAWSGGSTSLQLRRVTT